MLLYCRVQELSLAKFKLNSTTGEQSVELNDGLVARTERAATKLTEGDRVEIVTLVGGG